MARFYITTTLPYVNADPHIGFALEVVQADVLARYRAALGDEVFFNTGTDEHGLKIYRKALEEKKDPQAYADEYAAKFERLKSALNLSYNNFIRTTDPHHVLAAQEFWKRCEANGDIYKKEYRVKYCIGCELEKTDSELVDGKCPLHPLQDLEHIEEENYFFRFSKYQKPLLDLYAAHSDFVVPASRLHEIRSFVERGLEDFSISRLKEKMPWGVPVPGNSDHVMYVWFDALVNYISALGWPNASDKRQATSDKDSKFGEFWGTKEKPNAVQIAGKDNLRQQAAMWQAMLLSAELPTSKQIFIHGFITHDGGKMSKSVGNVVNPIDLAARYGTDAIRYFLLRGIHAYEDSDFSEKRFEEIFNSDLANGIGNFVQRVTTLAEKAGISNKDLDDSAFKDSVDQVKAKVKTALERFEFHEAIQAVWSLVAAGDRYVNETKVWEKEGSEQKKILGNLASLALNIGNLLHAFLPETAEEILKRFGLTLAEVRSTRPNVPRQNDTVGLAFVRAGQRGTLAVKKGEPLFRRI